MRQRYTAKQRDIAADICAIAACEPRHTGMALYQVSEELDQYRFDLSSYFATPAHDLATAARDVASTRWQDSDREDTYELACAEACSMIRDGWCPGDVLDDEEQDA